MKLSKWPKKKQVQKESPTPSLETNQAQSISSPQESQQDIPSSILLRRTCKDVSIDAFIQAYCNNDYAGLIIKGNPTHEQIQVAWNEVLFEHSSLIKSEQSEYFFELEKQMSLLRWHINYVDNAIRFLRLRYDEDMVTELKSLGYDGDFKTEEVLDRTISLAKTKVYELEVLHDEYSRLKKTVTGKEQSEEEFERTVSMLSKYQQYHIDTFTTSIYRFDMIFNNYLLEQKALQKHASQG